MHRERNILTRWRGEPLGPSGWHAGSTSTVKQHTSPEVGQNTPSSPQRTDGAPGGSGSRDGVGASQKAHGDCRPAGRRRDIVLHCDDDTDCPRGGDGGRLAGIGVVSYAQSDSAPYSPLEIAHANCRAALLGNGGLDTPMSLALCEERKPCADSQFDCWPRSMESELLPGYNWCHVVF